MISVEQAQQIITNHSLKIKSETVPLEAAQGRILAEKICADQDFPAFDRVSMDGIAIQKAEFVKGRREFKIEGIQAAGSEQLTLSDAENCLEVMTGAILPANTDLVIPYEDVDIDNKAAFAKVKLEEIGKVNYHLKAADRKKGDVLIEKGKRIGSPEIAVLASVGKDNVKVNSLPRIAVVSTGDELVDIDVQPLPHQIRRSNSYMLQSELKKLGFESSMLHINDKKQEMQVSMKEVLSNFDVVILSGGVSKGKYDFVPEILEELQVTKQFHRVSQRPGKPFWFGAREMDNTVVFALPGNPVSTFACFLKYIQPWLCPDLEREYAVLTEDFNFEPALTYFLQVKANMNATGELVASPIPGKGSGDFANLLDCNGFLELPGNKTEFKKGEVYSLLKFR